MNVEITLKTSREQEVHVLKQALQSYDERLQAAIARTRRRLAVYEARYGLTTEEFLATMTAEDLQGGDLEYVEWAGEAQVLAGLEAELADLSNVRVQLS
ncbi:MAG: hypothetical protein GXP38_02335 [Chloroflexi bacterium]|nr:hypothetical protein [Chloroflexota bacterium]